MNPQTVIWQAAVSLKLTVRELASVLDLSFSVASKKLRGAVPWTFADVEALNKVLPPGQKLAMVTVGESMITDHSAVSPVHAVGAVAELAALDGLEPLIPLVPVEIPLRADSREPAVVPPGFTTDIAGRLIGAGAGNERSRKAALRRAVVLELARAGLSAEEITDRTRPEFGNSLSTIRNDLRVLEADGLILRLPKEVHHRQHFDVTGIYRRPVTSRKPHTPAALNNARELAMAV